MNTTEYEKRLQDEALVLESELASVGVRNPNASGDFEATEGNDFDGSDADSNVAADAQEAFGERQALVAALEPRLYDVRLALDKIKNGHFGVCEIGGEEIEAERLAADPAARTCMEHIHEEESLNRS